MDDLDTPRIKRGSATEILRTLELFGLAWDGPVEYQTHQTDRYVAALATLRQAGLTYECSCSRRELASSVDRGYPGTCRAGPTRKGATATRFRLPDAPDNWIAFEDAIQGACRFDLSKLGDVVIRRRDHIVSYQLAVVVDDACQKVTHVVRGADLLDSTAWQVALQRSLCLPAVQYAHLPLILDRKHGKLSKSRGSVALEPTLAASQLGTALRLLQHPPPAELEHESTARLLQWATAAWDPKQLHGVSAVTSTTS